MSGKGVMVKISKKNHLAGQIQPIQNTAWLNGLF
jgi:hypothetical protein